jgi:hypothetical protein
MTRLLRHLSPYAQVMTGGILVLASVIVLEIAWLDFGAASATLAGDSDTGDTAVAPAAGGADVVSIPPLPTYRELLTRPLFMETRRPVPRATAAQTARRIDPGTQWKLTAIIVAGEDSHVFVQGLRDNTIRRLDSGQMLDGWRVSEITPQYVTFTAGDQESRLELRQEADPK